MATTTRVADPNVNGTVYTDNLNDALEALDTCHSGPTAPTDEVANGKFWLDTSTAPQTLKVRRDGTWYAVAVNSGTVWVDYANRRVGIGTTSPDVALDVEVDGAASLRLTRTNAVANYAQLRVGGAKSEQLTIESNVSNQAGGYTAFAVGGAEAVRIKNDGNVGIGTNNPAYLLDVSKGAGGSVARIRNGSSGGTPSSTHGELIVESNEVNLGIQLLGTNTSNQKILFGDASRTGSGQITYDHTSDYMSVHTNNTERMRIDANGDVGIGTTDPKEKLHVSGTGESVLVTPVPYSANQDAPYLIAGSTSYNGATTNWGSYGIQHRLKVDASGVPRVTIDTNTGEVFCVRNTSVGIGTPAPGSELDVHGTGDIIRSTAPDATANFLAFYDDTGRKGIIGYSSTTDGMTVANDRNDYFRVLTNSGERLRITGTGDIGIGTTSPAEKLDVNGTVKATGVSLGGTTFTNAPIGEGQQWYNDGSFTAGTAYQNTYGRPIQVMLSMQGAGSKTLGLSHNGTTWVETLNLDNDGSDHDVNTTFTVPAGHRWRITGTFTNGRRLTLR